MGSRPSRYHDVYQRWQRDPEGFWGEAAQAVDWYERPTKIFDASAGICGHWFADGVCNTCWNAVDRHVQSGRAEQTAIIYDSPVTDTCETITYAELKSRIQVLARIL